MLSGKFTEPQGSEPGTRIDPASITAQQRAVARAVQSAADDLGATASQVAIAWTRALSPAIHSIIGACGWPNCRTTSAPPGSACRRR